MSADDIDRGTKWFGVIQKELETTDFGIVVLTKDNLKEPWLLFEAGAVSKGTEQTHVAPLLVGVDKADVKAPLSHFQSTICEKSEVLALVQTINRSTSKPLTNDVLENSFEKHWNDFEKIISESKKIALEAPEKKRPQDELISEILDIVRGLARNENKTDTLAEKLYKSYLVAALRQGTSPLGAGTATLLGAPSSPQGLGLFGTGLTGAPNAPTVLSDLMKVQTTSDQNIFKPSSVTEIKGAPDKTPASKKD